MSQKKPPYDILQVPKVPNNERTQKVAKEKHPFTYEVKPIRIMQDFTAETLKALVSGMTYFKHWEKTMPI